MLVFPQPIDLNACKGVLLDLDNTLYEYEPAHSAALNACKQRFAELKLELGFTESYDQARQEIKAELGATAASHSRLLYFQRMFELVSARSDFELSLEFEKLYWGTFISNMQLDAQAKAFLDELKTKQIKTCIVTDLTAQVQHQKLSHFGLQEHINYLVSSEEAGVEKPEAGMFELALRKLKLQASEVIMIGDSLPKDIKGAEQLGIKAYLVEIK